MSTPSDCLDEMLERYNLLSQYPDIRELAQLLCDVTHEEKVRIVMRYNILYIEAYYGRTEIITTILSSLPQHQMLDVLQFLVGDYTPLHQAARWDKSDCVETILTHLTPEQQLKILSLRDVTGKTPVDYASQQETKKLLIHYQQVAEQSRNPESETSNKNKDKILHNIPEVSGELKVQTDSGGASNDRGGEVIEEQLTVAQPATNN